MTDGSTKRGLADYLFLGCAGYFVAMATAHFFGLKYPILFIYYDVPFYAYQDKIISFAVLAYVALFFEAFRHAVIRPTAILVMLATVLGLSAVNLSQALREVMPDGHSTVMYWLQTLMILLITLALAGVHFFSRKANRA